MNHSFRPFCLEVWGDYACFTRPELKVERVSYDVPTPSAVRAIFEAIFWKPAIRWHVKRIEVLHPIKWVTIRRNEVASRASHRSQNGILIEDDRQQRAAIVLKDVRYRLFAFLEYLPPGERRASTRQPVPEFLWDVEETPLYPSLQHEDTPERQGESAGKYLAIFERRARKGQCFMQPYLGCREFSCFFRLVDDPEHERNRVPPIDETRDLGIMLFDIDYTDPSQLQPLFFRARIERGVIDVPLCNSQEILR